MHAVHWSRRKPSWQLDLCPAQGIDLKPCGLWLSWDEDPDGWKAWCKAEAFERGRVRTVFEVDEARLLCIRTLKEFDAFHRRFRAPTERFEGSFEGLDWSAVAKEAAGIVIRPYQPRRRFTPMWYYPWDCASACVWDLSAVRVA